MPEGDCGCRRPVAALAGHREVGDDRQGYPDELLSIELYTKGQVKPGDVITADNVDVVKDLLDPIAYRQVKEMGRHINIVETTRDVTKLFPHEYLEATLRNAGRARFDANGNVVTDDGSPWIGGNPFPNAQTGEEAFYNLTLSWGRHDESVYAVRDWDISPNGTLSYQYDFVWAEQNTVGLVAKPSPYQAGAEDKLRYQAVWFTSPTDARGTAFLNTWYYDQRKFPDLLGYLPAFKRVRNFRPTSASNRWSPASRSSCPTRGRRAIRCSPGATQGRRHQPHLGAVSGNWTGKTNANWEREVHGGPNGQTFFEDYKELIPEVLVVEAEPTGYPRAPVGKKRLYRHAQHDVRVVPHL